MLTPQQQTHQADPDFIPAGPDFIPVPQPAAAAPQQPQTTLQKIGQVGGDLLTGAGKGLLKSVSSFDDAASQIPYIGNWLTTPIGGQHTAEESARSRQHVKEMQAPANTTQAIGKGIEQAGEYLLPTGLEEAGAKYGGQLLGKAGEMLGRIGGSAVHSGAINKVQGGTFADGATAGAAGTGMGMAAKTIAPVLAETALKVRGADRAYGATPGRAILDHTKGFTPRAVVDSARAASESLFDRADQALKASPGAVDLQPTRKILSDAVDRAEQENHKGTTGDLEKLAGQLDKYHYNGAPISPFVSASDASALNRGLSNAVTAWNPAVANDTMNAVGKMAHHSLGEEISSVVPEVKPIYQATSSLRPVIQRGNAADLNAGLLQRVIGRFGTPTGALLGGAAGLHYGGIAGGLAGLAGPELLSNPSTLMMGARALNSEGLRKIAIPATVGAVLQAGRPSVFADPSQ